MNDKVQKLRIDFKNLKKENHNLRDSNENHIFINEKLNQALKKANARLEDLENKLAQYDGTSSNNISKKSTENTSSSDQTQNHEQTQEQKEPLKQTQNIPQKTEKMQVPKVYGLKEVHHIESSFGDVSSIMIMPD